MNSNQFYDKIKEIDKKKKLTSKPLDLLPLLRILSKILGEIPLVPFQGGKKKTTKRNRCIHHPHQAVRTHLPPESRNLTCNHNNNHPHSVIEEPLDLPWLSRSPAPPTKK